LILAGATAPEAAAFGHRGHGGVFVGFGFGLPGCCVFGGPLGYYPPYPVYGPAPAYYPPPGYYPPPAYTQPGYAQPAPTAYYPPAGAPAAAPAAAPMGDACREYQTTVTIDGRQQRAFGVTCRQPDGSWRIAR